MNEKYTLHMKKCEIYDSLFTENSINEILNISEKHINNPIFILDTSYRIITRSSLAKCVNSSIETHNGKDYLILDTIKLMIKNKCIDDIYNNDNSFFYHDDEILIFCSIKVNHITIGYICVLQNNRKFEEDDLILTNVLAKVVSMQIQKEDLFISNSGLDEEYYLMDLLTNKIDNIEYLKTRLKYSNFILNENLLVLSIPFKKEYSDYRHNFGLKELIKRLKDILGNCIATYYNDMIIFLISNETEQVITSNIKETLIKFLKLNCLKCGLSIIFRNILEIQEFYYQSTYALKFTKDLETTHIAYFEECIESYLFYTCENTSNDFYKIKISTLIHPWINKLMKFDHENKTELLETLKIYIKNNRNANVASNKLNIHRSTFFYRFNKIQSILGISLGSSNNLFELELSFKILKYLGY